MIRKSFKTILYLAIFFFLSQFAYAYNVVKLSPEYFPDTSRGRALSSADIYVGKPDLDPEIVGNQKILSVQQEDGTIVAVPQPIHTSAGGVPQYAGSPVTLLVDGDYSLKVLNSHGVQTYYVPSVLYYTPLTTPYSRYFPDYTEVDQGAVGGGNSVYDILAEVGAVVNTTLYFAHNSGAATTTYTFTTNIEITDNCNVVIEDGAILDGAGTLTINGPFEVGEYEVFGASITTVGFGSERYVKGIWWPDLQDAVDTGKIVLTGPRTITSTLKLRRVNGGLKGISQGGGGRWSGDMGQAILTYTGSNTEPMIEIGGDPTTGWDPDTNGFDNLENVYLGHVTLQPSIDYQCAEGILIDGSADYEGTRGFLREVTLEYVSVGYTAEEGILVIGNAFDITMRNVSTRQTQDTGISVDHAISVNVGVDRPGEVYMYNPYSNPATAGIWSMDLQYTRVFGGKVQGDWGVRLGALNYIAGLEIERAAGATTDESKIGLLVAGIRNIVNPMLIDGYGVGLQIGEDGSATQVVSNMGTIGTIQNCKYGVRIEDGGTRNSNRFSIGDLYNNTTDMDNQRESGDSIYQEVGFIIDGKNFNTYMTNDLKQEGAPQTLLAGEIILPSTPIVYITAASAITLDATTPISKATIMRGRKITIICTSAAGNTIAIPHTASCHNVGGGSVILNSFDQATYVYSKDRGRWMQLGTPKSHGIPLTLANDGTPTVLYGNFFLTGGVAAITHFDDGVEGKEIKIISEHTITITDGTNIFLNGSVNFDMIDTDTLTLIQKADGKWYEMARSDNT